MAQLEQDCFALDEHRIRNANSTHFHDYVLQCHCQQRQDDATALCKKGGEKWRSVNRIPTQGTSFTDMQAQNAW